MNPTPLVVAVDFDGTCVTHDFPNTGQDVVHCVAVLRKMRANGVLIVLNTMRSDSFLDVAVAWFAEREISLYGINRNPDQGFTNSPKVYAHFYVDDAAIGCPLITDKNISPRPFVNWLKIDEFIFGNAHYIEQIHTINLN